MMSVGHPRAMDHIMAFEQVDVLRPPSPPNEWYNVNDDLAGFAGAQEPAPFSPSRSWSLGSISPTSDEPFFLDRNGAGDVMWSSSRAASPSGVFMEMTPPTSPFSSQQQPVRQFSGRQHIVLNVDGEISVQPAPLPVAPRAPKSAKAAMQFKGGYQGPSLQGSLASFAPQGPLKLASPPGLALSQPNSLGGEAQPAATPTATETSKRSTHNVLERKRRHDLKNSYQALRSEIPGLEKNERAPTGVILTKAHEIIAELNSAETSLQAKIAAAKAERERLQAQRSWSNH